MHLLWLIVVPPVLLVALAGVALQGALRELGDALESLVLDLQ